MWCDLDSRSRNFGRFFWSLTLLFLVVNSSHPYPDLLACTESFPDATSHLYSQALDILACPIFSGFGRTIWLGILAQNTFMVWNSCVQCSYNPYIGLDSCWKTLRIRWAYRLPYVPIKRQSYSRINHHKHQVVITQISCSHYYPSEEDVKEMVMACIKMPSGITFLRDCKADDTTVKCCGSSSHIRRGRFCHRWERIFSSYEKGGVRMLTLCFTRTLSESWLQSRHLATLSRRISAFRFWDAKQTRIGSMAKWLGNKWK